MPGEVTVCVHAIDERRYAMCAVCAGPNGGDAGPSGGVRGRRLCLDCARTHFCTSECASRGCKAGLCVKLVRDGVVASAYGVPAGATVPTAEPPAE